MRAFIINLDGAGDRWDAITAAFAPTSFPLVRVPAVDGSALALPHPDFDERRFRNRHGRATNLREVGCYLSHVASMRAFLATSDEHGLICEDDVRPGADFEKVIAHALRHARLWDILRLSGLGRGTPLKVRRLFGAYDLCVSLGRVKGAGAYIVNRAAAQRLVKGLLPMWLPFDHAIDREWMFGLRAAYVLDYPCSQTSAGFRSSIQTGKTGKTKSRRRWVTTYPYQAANEVARWLARSAHCAAAMISRSEAADSSG